MRLSTLVAGVSGPIFALARRLRVSTRATRQADRQGAVGRPDAGARPAAAGTGSRPVRVLLLGNGPVEGPGLVAGEPTLADRLADALAARLESGVQVTPMLGGGWDEGALAAALERERFHWFDALVVSVSYRPQLAEIPVGVWRRYTARLRDVLVDSAGPDAVMRALALPWAHAVKAAPAEWGGAFGSRVIALARTAEGVLRDDRRLRLLRLAEPASPHEWVGPAFSPATYQAWAEQVAGDLAEGLAERVG